MPSAEYLLYDLSRSPSQNRSARVGLEESVDVGTAIYPVGWMNESGDNIGAPEIQRHGLLSRFFWAQDSGAIVFADILTQSKPDIVLVTVDRKATATASVSPFPDTVLCENPDRTTVQPTSLRKVGFGPEQGKDRIVLVDFEASGCVPKTLQITQDRFRPAAVEPRIFQNPTRRAIKGGESAQ